MGFTALLNLLELGQKQKNSKLPADDTSALSLSEIDLERQFYIRFHNHLMVISGDMYVSCPV